MICLAPAVAAVVNIEIGGLIGTLGLSTDALGAWASKREALLLLGNGFVVTGMVWATLLARVIDGELAAAARTSLLAAALVLCGAMHSPFADGRMFLPGAATPTVVFSVAGGYVLVALCFIMFHAFGTTTPRRHGTGDAS
jgi:AGZA family xanthine/uracil permease-like MFS transporter